MADVLAPLRVKPERVNDEDWSSKRWMPDDKEGFVLGLLVSQSGDSAVVTRQDTKQQLTVKAADLERVNPPKFNKIEDMTNMAVLNPPSVLFNLKDRYYADLIYTYSGLFCIVVNPYKSLPIYTPEIVQAYKGQKRADLPPHVFAVADEAYRSMLQDNENQSILCTGESGAGKTENTKKVIQYLASVALGGSSRRAARTVTEAARRRKSSIGLSKDALGQGELERQLLEANPVLETFGNARTVKNDNSSRFGKFIKIHFDSSGSIMGATINTYLLEKSRAVLQNNDERNFHGFYQLLRGASPELKKELLLNDINSYRFITNGDKPKPANVDDAKEYQNTNGSLKVMGFTDDEIKSVWRTISAVLMFGQLKFEEDRKEQAFFQGSNDIDAQKLCQLLGIDIAKFTRALLKPETKAGGNTINLSVSKKKAEFTTEALAKATYERLFLYIVKRINDVLNTREVKKFIGILDIAGFEIFQINSFEQLCINFTNEKLQQLFNTRFFFLEQKIYQDEEIAWEDIDFSGLDLKSTIDLIENKTGVLALLDEQCFFPRANDKTLLDKFVEILGKHPKFAKPGPREEGTFGIVHYAGKVTYTVNQWLDKNKDPLNDNVTELLENSSDKLIATLWGQDMTSNFTGGRKGNFRTVGNIYKEQLSALVDMLTTTTTHFVRCIIPNHQKRAGLIDGHLVWEQLRCNGVLEGIRICRSGFPSRWPFQEFRQRFSILCPDAVPKSAGFIEGKRAVELMVAALQLPAEMFRIGRTKAFFKNDTIDDLERQRDAKLTTMILRFQARCRGYIVRRVTNNGPQYRAAVEIIQRNARAYLKLRSWPWWNLFTKIKPLIKGAAQDEELRVLREDVQKWKDKFEREEKLRIEAEGQVDMLHEEKRRLEEQLRAENDALREAAAIRERLNTRKIELENDNQELETQLQEQIDTSAKLLEEKRTLTSQLTEIKQDLQKSNVNEARISRLEAQLTEAKEKFERQVKEASELEESRAKLDKELRDLQSQLDDVSAAKAKLERAKTKLQGELDDLSASRDKDVAQVAALEKKQRQFDTQIKDFKIQIDQAGADRDSAQAEVRQLQTTVLSLKNEINSLTDRADSAEKAKKRLQIELDEVMEKKDDRSLAEIENAKRELQRQVDEQRQTILELEDEVHLAEKAKQGLEVTLHALEEKMASMNVGASEEEENKRRALQRQVKEMEEEIEAERRSKTKIQNEKRKLETDVKALQEQLDEETRNHQKDAALLKKLEKKVKLLDSAMAGDGLLGEATSVEMEKLRKKIREYKQELNDAEDQISKANLSKRKAERELEEHMQMTSTYEAEINQLRAQIRRLKNKDEPFDLSLLESPPKGATSVTVKITEKVTRRDDEDV